MSKTELLSTTQWGRAMIVVCGGEGGSVRRAVDKESSDCVGDAGVRWGRCQNTNEFWTFQVDLAEGVMRTNITQEPRARMNGCSGRERSGGMDEGQVSRSQAASRKLGEAGGKAANNERRYPEFVVAWVYSVELTAV